MQAKFIWAKYVLWMLLITGLYGCGGFSMMKPAAEKIVSAKTGQSISFETMISELSMANVIYVGEQHANPAHHTAQLKIIQALMKDNPDLVVGMEMFSVPYQPVLDEWTAGYSDESAFLRKTQWYANWKFDYALYRDILNFIKEHHIHLTALNIPFHIPPKIAVGGLDNLPADDKKYLPKTIDLQNQAHRAYVENIFKRHPLSQGRESFEDFYAAQCVWEDAMAESLVEYKKMIVLAGNGHIFRKFGIPDRAFQRNGLPFKTVILISNEKELDLSAGDYLWLLPAHP